MSGLIDTRIKDALKTLSTVSEIESESPLVILKTYQNRFVELYSSDEEIVSLTQEVLLNNEVNFLFCVRFQEISGLWQSQDMINSFAKSLKRCENSLLLEALYFLPDYHNKPQILDAIAYNLSICPDIIYQINLVRAGFGLSDLPVIKDAILSRKDLIFATIRNDWHISTFILLIPYLRNNSEFKHAILYSKNQILEEIREEERLLDVVFLIKHLEWLRNDSDIINAFRERISDVSKELNRGIVKYLMDSGMFQEHEKLREAYRTRKEHVK